MYFGTSRIIKTLEGLTTTVEQGLPLDMEGVVFKRI